MITGLHDYLSCWYYPNSNASFFSLAHSKSLIYTQCYIAWLIPMNDDDLFYFPLSQSLPNLQRTPSVELELVVSFFPRQFIWRPSTISTSDASIYHWNKPSPQLKSFFLPKTLWLHAHKDVTKWWACSNFTEASLYMVPMLWMGTGNLMDPLVLMGYSAITMPHCVHSSLQSEGWTWVRSRNRLAWFFSYPIS